MSHDESHGSAGTGRTLAAQVRRVTGRSPIDCYQCGRCAAGCPQNVEGAMDVSPTRIMHLLQMQCALGEDSPAGEEYAKRAMEAQTPWLCAGCMACTTRCPQGVDIAGTMDVLRQEGLRRGTTSSARRVKDIQALHRTFLAKALKRGRIHEVGLVMGYKMRTGHLLADAHLAPKMWWKGKLHLLGGRKVDTARVKEAIQTLKQARRSSTGGRASRGTGIGEKGGS